MYLDNLNLNTLRVFDSVYSLKSMTEAAKALHLTQSGVSQHMKAMEEALGISLFDRINKKLVPTQKAQILYRQVHTLLHQLESSLSEITDNKEEQLKGEVRIGLPIEFGNNKVIPFLSKWGKEHKNLIFKIDLDFATNINTALLSGNLDFAIIDEYSMDKRIHIEKIFEESLYLCAEESYAKKFGTIRNTKQFYEQLDYIAYKEGEPVLRSWFSHFTHRKNLTLNVRSYVMDVQGVARFIIEGLGAGVLPNHLILKLEATGHHIHRFNKKEKPLTNRLSLAYLNKKTQSYAAEKTLESLKKYFSHNTTPIK